MIADYPEAVSQTQKLFKTAWLANSGLVFGYVPAIEWHGLETLGKEDRAKVWVRFSMQNLTQAQATLSTCVMQPYQRRHEGSGLVFIQLFLPKSVDNAIPFGRKLAQVALAAFRAKKTEGGVIFRNTRINDGIPPEEMFYRINVVSEYEYDELS